MVAAVAVSAAEERAVAGKELRKPSKGERKRIEAAVDAAEEVTGLQLCVYVGEDAGTNRSQAEALFVATGLAHRPAILILVAPAAHHVELVTGPDVVERFPDDAAQRAVDAMTAWFARGRLVEGLEAGIEVLVEVAGPGEAPPDAVELPDFL